MPNWKTYESSVRLLSAIIAAHPGLKLNYDAIAREYGDGVTGEGSGSAKKTPSKPRAPRGSKKNTPAKNKASSADDDDDEEEVGSVDGTPSKGPLHKVKNGRVTKASPRAKKPVSYLESDDDENDEEMIKNEPDRGFADLAHHHNGNGDSYNGSFASTNAARQENWYEAEELLGEEEEI